MLGGCLFAAGSEVLPLFTLQTSHLGCWVPCSLRDSSASCWRSRSVYSSLHQRSKRLQFDCVSICTRSREYHELGGSPT